MATGASRFRPRPIDYDRPLPVVKSQNELELNDEGVLVPKRDMLTESMDDVDEMDTETLRIIQEQYDKDAKKANIPVPPILTIDDYDKHVPRDYVRPQSYVRFKPLTEKELDERLEYEMDEPDMEFVSKTLQQQHKLVLNEDKFEQIIDRLEKESFKLGKMCDINVLEPYKLASGKIVALVFDYWKRKREKLGKALIRRFQPPTSINDTSPHNTFRPREKEEKRIRRTRMKDKDAHKNLRQFHADFKRAKELLENLVKREKAKKALLQLDFCLKFAKEIKDIPAPILKQQEDFFKEWHRDRDKAKQSNSKRVVVAEAADDDAATSTAGSTAAAASAGRPRGGSVAVRPAPVVEAEPVVQLIEEGGDEKARRQEGIKRCFQSLMRRWDGSVEAAGTSLLPLLVRSSSTSSPWSARMYTAGVQVQDGEILNLRGRGRIGRGGRLIFDVCSRHSAQSPSTPPAENPPPLDEDGSCGDGSAGASHLSGLSDVLRRAKRKREELELARCAPGPDARKIGPAFIDALWEEMKSTDRSESASASAGTRSCCWSFGTGAKSSYLDP